MVDSVARPAAVALAGLASMGPPECWQVVRGRPVAMAVTVARAARAVPVVPEVWVAGPPHRAPRVPAAMAVPVVTRARRVMVARVRPGMPLHRMAAMAVMAATLAQPVAVGQAASGQRPVMLVPVERRSLPAVTAVRAVQASPGPTWRPEQS
jgi:hypothetical protein